MTITATPASAEHVLALREQYRQEMNCQVVHDSIHRRRGWTTTYRLEVAGTVAGFGSVAIAGPWEKKPTLFEMYLLPAYRARSFDAFEALVLTSQARFMTVQSNDWLLPVMLRVYAQDIAGDAIVFRDGLTTSLPANGAVMIGTMSETQIRHCIEARDGGPEWRLELHGETVGTGGILFHYNRPYGDIYMDITESHRRRGFGAYLVQELKRLAYELNCIPAARCNPENVPSRKTLQKAGLVPYATILTGTLRST